MPSIQGEMEAPRRTSLASMQPPGPFISAKVDNDDEVIQQKSLGGSPNTRQPVDGQCEVLEAYINSRCSCMVGLGCCVRWYLRGNNTPRYQLVQHL
jgi:hypothetical protein